MRIDLHTHSNASDGEHSPAKLVELAAEDGIKLLALTDHDTVAGLREGCEAAGSAGIGFVAGIEISTELSEACLEGILREEGSSGCGQTGGFSPEDRKLILNEDIHVLGLGIDGDNRELGAFCEKYMHERLDRGPKICAYLAGIGISVDLDEVHEIRGNASLGRPHFAEYLIRHGYVESKAEAFDRYLDTDEFNAETKRLKPTPYEAVRIIHEAGGRAVLAHPGLLRFRGLARERVIASLVRAGLDGIECFYNKHDETETGYFLSLMKQLGVRTGCGSDFHGEGVKKGVRIGMELPEEYLDDLIIDIKK